MTTPPASGESTPPAPGTTLPLPEGDLSPALPNKRIRPRWVRIVRWTAGSMGVIVLLAAGFVVGDYFYLNGKITKQPVVLPSGVQAPPKIVARAENFVLIGSDTRAGANGKGTGGAAVAGARSDTTMILHIFAGGGGAVLVSIPRDSYVQIPSCVIGPNGQTSAPEMNKFNAAYSIGGEYNNRYAASCTVHTIETLTGLHIDHYAVVDFVGFKRMVDALGGIHMCVATPLVDPIRYDPAEGINIGSGLNLPAGPHVKIDGTQALALMRARYALDGGGDLPRIKRQQEFVAAMIHKATSTSLLIDPFKLQSFLVAATSSLTTDGFGLGTMKTLAEALHKVGAGGVHLLTVPNVTDAPGMPYGDVEWDPTKAPALWMALRHDQPIPGLASPTPSPSVSASPTPTGAPLTVPPSNIYVTVENGTATAGLAHTVASQLTAQGYHVVSVGDADKETYTTTEVRYGSEKVQSSQTVAAAFPGSERVADPTAGSTITIVVGSDFTKVSPVTIASATSPSPTPTISSISAAKPGCLS